MPAAGVDTAAKQAERAMGAAAHTAKKTPATTPAWEYCFCETNRFFKEKAALPEHVGESGAITEERVVRLLFISLCVAFQFCSLSFATH
jgi:hypothetical protein